LTENRRRRPPLHLPAVPEILDTEEAVVSNVIVVTLSVGAGNLELAVILAGHLAVLGAMMVQGIITILK
jgi:hypothetical protein